MNVTVQVTDLVRELELLVKVVATKPTIPVLANILVHAEGDGLRLATTDLEIGLVTFCPAVVYEPGVTTLPAKHLLDVLRLLNGEATFTLDKAATMRLVSGGYKSRLQTLSASDYPAMPSMKDLPSITLTGLQEAIRRGRFAISDKNKRYYMDGALLTFTEDGYTLATTDGHRLAYSHNPSETWVVEPIIIPSKALDKLMEIPGDVLVAASTRHIFFVVDGRMLFSRTIDGKFPNYSRIIPQETTHKALLPRDVFRVALQRVALTAMDVTCKFTAEQLTMTSRSSEIGDAFEQIELQHEGVDTTVIVNGTYLLDFLNVATSGQIVLTWKDGGALLFTDSESYAYVQMPLRNV